MTFRLHERVAGPVSHAEACASAVRYFDGAMHRWQGQRASQTPACLKAIGLERGDVLRMTRAMRRPGEPMAPIRDAVDFANHQLRARVERCTERRAS